MQVSFPCILYGENPNIQLDWDSTNPDTVAQTFKLHFSDNWNHPGLCKQITVYMHRPLLQYQGKCTQQKQSMSQLFYGLCAAVLLVGPGINQQVTDIQARRWSIWSWVTVNLKVIPDQLMLDYSVMKLHAWYVMLMMKPYYRINLGCWITIIKNVFHLLLPHLASLCRIWD